MKTPATDGSGDAPLNTRELLSLVVRPGGLWRELRVVAETGSTNADLLARARAGAAEGTVLVAEAQTAARGRLGRAWTSPPGGGLTFSVLLRPAGVPSAALGWAPLLAGVAAAGAVRAETGVEARLKWPNDLLVGDRKLAGILAEAWDGAVVVGVGLNVFQERADLPVPAATSLRLEARPGRPAVSREALLAGLLARLAETYLAWRDQPRPGDPDDCGLRAAYLRECATIGRRVAASLPGGRSVTGTAAGVDRSGRLEIATEAGDVVPVSAGDVVHLR